MSVFTAEYEDDIFTYFPTFAESVSRELNQETEEAEAEPSIQNNEMGLVEDPIDEVSIAMKYAGEKTKECIKSFLKMAQPFDKYVWFELPEMFQDEDWSNIPVDVVDKKLIYESKKLRYPPSSRKKRKCVVQMLSQNYKLKLRKSKPKLNESYRINKGSKKRVIKPVEQKYYSRKISKNSGHKNILKEDQNQSYAAKYVLTPVIKKCVSPRKLVYFSEKVERKKQRKKNRISKFHSVKSTLKFSEKDKDKKVRASSRNLSHDKKMYLKLRSRKVLK